MTNRSQATSCLLLALLLAGCQQRSAGPGFTAPLEGELLLPTRDCGELFMAAVEINGQGPLQMVVDTGAAPAVVLTSAAADRLFGRDHPARIDRVRIGDFEARDCDLRVLGLEDVRAALDPDFAGIIGFTLFRDVLLTLDYPRRELRVAPGRLDPAVPGTVAYHADPRPFLPVRAGDVGGRMLLDSGSTGTLGVRRLDGWLLDGEAIALRSSASARGSYVSRGARLAGNATWGPLTLERPTITTRNKSTSIVGADVFDGFAITFDQRRRLVRFAGPLDRPVTFAPVRSPGCILAPDPAGGLRVIAVMPDSSADRAGLREGDRVVAIDETVIDRLTCAWRNAGGADPADRERVYRVLRGDETLEFRIAAEVVIP